MGTKAKRPEIDNGEEPAVWDQKTIRQSVEALRFLLMEIEGVALRMGEKNIPSLTLEAGEGAGGYKRAKAGLRAWATGMGNALVNYAESGKLAVTDR